MTYRVMFESLSSSPDMRDVKERMRADEVYYLDLIEESPVAILQQRVVAHWILFYDLDGRFISGSQLTLREDTSLDEFYHHLEQCGELVPLVLTPTRHLAVEISRGFGIVQYEFRPLLHLARDREDSETFPKREAALLRAGRSLIDDRSAWLSPGNNQERLIL